MQWGVRRRQLQSPLWESLASCPVDSHGDRPCPLPATPCIPPLELCPHTSPSAPTKAFVFGLRACLPSPFRESYSLPLSNAEDFTVRLWPRQLLTLPQKAEDFPCGTELLGHKGPVNCCSFSTDGGSLATGGRDRVSHRRMQPLGPAPPGPPGPLGPTAPLVPGFLNGPIAIASSGYLLCQTCAGSAHASFLDTLFP